MIQNWRFSYRKIMERAIFTTVYKFKFIDQKNIVNILKK